MEETRVFFASHRRHARTCTEVYSSKPEDERESGATIAGRQSIRSVFELKGATLEYLTRIILIFPRGHLQK